MTLQSNIDVGIVVVELSEGVKMDFSGNDPVIDSDEQLAVGVEGVSESPGLFAFGHGYCKSSIHCP